MAISHLALLIPGNYGFDAPRQGLEETLSLFTLAEELGFDSAWVRQRHLERGVSSAATFMAAATQRTSRIGLGTGVIPLGYETPLRLAEDLATVDVLSGGRLNVGVSAGPAAFADLLGPLLPLKTPAAKHETAALLARALRSEPLAEESLSGNAAGAQVPRVLPHAAGLTERLWYGAGSTASAAWAAQNGWHLLTGNVITAEESEDFLTTQRQLIETHRRHWAGPGTPGLGLGRVILLTDSATREQAARYRAYRDARLARTRAPNGPGRLMFLPDLVGHSEEILAALARDPVLPLSAHLRFELPYEFEAADYRQILSDAVKLFAPLRHGLSAGRETR